MESADKLIREATAGDEAAVARFLELIRTGDRRQAEAAVRRLLRGGGSRTAPRESACAELPHYPQELKALVKSVDEDPLRALPRVEAMLLEPHGPCFTIQVLGCRAQIERSRGDLEAAEKALAEAWALAERTGCPDSVTELLRRRAWLRESQNRRAESLADVEEALRRYRLSGTPGHDPDGNGIANCLSFRAQLMDAAFGDVDAAVRDFGACLARLSHRASPELYDYTVVNFARAISRADRALWELAYDLIREPRQSFKGPASESKPRAKLDWFEAQLHWALRKPRPGYVMTLLKRSQGGFVKQGDREEALGVTADVQRVAFPDQTLIRDNLNAVRPALASMVGDEPLGWALHDIWTISNIRTLSSRHVRALDRAIAKLRAAVTPLPGVLPFLLKR